MKKLSSMLFRTLIGMSIVDPASDAIAQLHGGPHSDVVMRPSDNSIMQLWRHQLSSQAKARGMAGHPGPCVSQVRDQRRTL